MKRRNNEQPSDKKPVVANKKLWRELTEGLQATVSGGLCDGRQSDLVDRDSLSGGVEG